MSEQEKIEMLEELFDLEDGHLTPDMELGEIEEYDSMTKLSLIVMMDDEFGVSLTGDDLKKLSTVKDLLNLMKK